MKKWNKDTIYQEAKNLIKEYGDLPGQHTLIKLGKVGFVIAVTRRYPGKMTQLRKDLKLKLLQKEAGYWTKEKIIEETKKLIEAEGKMSSQKRLRQLGFSSINAGARKHFNGLRGLAIACGISADKLHTEFGYFQNIENIKKEILSIKKKIGRFPTTTDLKLHSKSGLYCAIVKTYGGIKNIKYTMGFADDMPIAADGHFCDSKSEIIIDDFLYTNNIPHKRNIQINFKDIKCRPDFVLSNGYLIEVLMADYRKSGHKGRYKYYVGRYKKKRKAYLRHGYKVIEVFPEELIDRTKLDDKLTIIGNLAEAPAPYILIDFSKISFFDKKSPGYWKDLDNLRKELLPLVKQFGHIPTIKELRKIGRNDIKGAIANVHGSYLKVAQLLDLETDNIIKPQGYWQDIKNIKVELKPLIDEYGCLPSRTTLKQKGMGSLINAIDQQYGTFDNLAKELNIPYKFRKRTNGYWHNADNIKKELDKMVKALGRFPSAEELRKANMHGLLNGIFALYRTFQNACIQMGYELSPNKSKGYWRNLDNVLQEFDKVVQNHNSIPTWKIIEKENPMLVRSIKDYHGGMKKVRQLYIGKQSKKYSRHAFKLLPHHRSELADKIQ